MLPPKIVDMILQNPDEKWFKGEIINATVMFADIRGFTSFSEKRDPTEVVNVLNEYFTMATEIIFKYGGHVDKFIGDEIMSVFGAIVEQKGHPAKAVMAAVALQNELKDRNLKNKNQKTWQSESVLASVRANLLREISVPIKGWNTQ